MTCIFSETFPYVVHLVTVAHSYSCVFHPHLALLLFSTSLLHQNLESVRSGPCLKGGFLFIMSLPAQTALHTVSDEYMPV